MKAVIDSLLEKDEAGRKKAVLETVHRGNPAGAILLLELCKSVPSHEIYYLARKGADLLEKRQKNRSPVNRTDLSVMLRDYSVSGPAARIRTVLEIARQGRKDLVPDLKGLLSGERDGFIKAAVLGALGQLAGERELNLISGFLHNRDPRIRATAVEVLGRTQKPSIMPQIRPFLLDRWPRVRINSALALFDSLRQEVRATVIDMLKSGKPWHIESVLYLLSIKPMTDDAIRSLLLAISKRAKTRSLKEKIAKTVRDLSFARMKETPCLLDNPEADALAVLQKKIRRKKTVARAEKLAFRVPDLPKNRFEQMKLELMQGDFERRRAALLDLCRHPGKEYREVLADLSRDQHSVIRYFARKALSLI